MATVLTIGNFDGVHRGHAALVAAARAMAGPKGRVVAVTFDPSPGVVLVPERVLPRIGHLAQRIADLRHAGADEVEVVTPTLESLNEEALGFAHRMVKEYNLVGGGWVEGVDFRFGRGRVGDMPMLRMLGDQLGFSVRVVDPVEVSLESKGKDGASQVAVSSSLVRGLIEAGKMEDVTACLDRMWTLTGQVVHGEKRGRALGIPTANLDPAAWEGLAMPPEGVYAGMAKVDGTLYPAAISVGSKPMFGGQALAIEAHFLRFQGGADAVYGQPMTLGFGSMLRPQRIFPDVDALLGEIRRDIAHTDRWFSVHGGPLACSLSGIF